MIFMIIAERKQLWESYYKNLCQKYKIGEKLFW